MKETSERVNERHGGKQPQMLGFGLALRRILRGPDATI